MISVSTTILPAPVLDRVKRSKIVYGLGRKIRFGLGSLLGARNIPGIEGRVHYNDFMLRSTSADDIKAYSFHAKKFVDLLESELRAATGKTWPFNDAEHVLDIGCGYGRIVRALCERIDPLKVFVSDVIDEGARFTAREFGVNRMSPLEETQGYDGFFDLVYMLSVYTHTPVAFMRTHLRRVADVLKPGGLLVFTLQGPVSAMNAEQYGCSWLDKQAVLGDLKRHGWSFQQYPHYHNTYGMTWHTESYVRECVAASRIPLRFARRGEAEHGGHADVYVFVRD